MATGGRTLWYYLDEDNHQRGPYKSAKMQAWLDDGSLTPDDQVRRFEQLTWTKLRDLGSDCFLAPQPKRPGRPPPRAPLPTPAAASTSSSSKAFPFKPDRRLTATRRARRAVPVPRSVLHQHREAAAQQAEVNSKTRAPPPRPPSSKPTDANMASGKEDKASKMARMRRKVAEEIVSTEKSYVASLGALMSLYVQPLRAGSASVSLDPNQLRLVFSNIATIHQLNKSLLDDLTKRVMTSWENGTTCLGDLFLQFIPYFKMYKQYINGYGPAMELVTTLLSTNKRFASFAEQCAKDPSAKGTSLESFLIMPVQRIPRYKLLLQELLKNTQSSHPDHPLLEKAMESIASVATNINEAVRDFENRQAVWGIQKLFAKSAAIDNLMAPHRTFIRQAVLNKIRPNGDTKSYHFFLFSDLLIYGRKGLGKIKLKRQLPIDKWFFVERLPFNPQEKLQPPHALGLVSRSKSLVILANDEDERDSWLESFEECIAQYQNGISLGLGSSGQAGQLQPDNASTVTHCHSCSQPFGLQHKRLKFHCRNCAHVVCASCSPSRVDIKFTADSASAVMTLADFGVPADEDEPAEAPDRVRVCTDCMNVLFRDELGHADKCSAKPVPTPAAPTPSSRRPVPKPASVSAPPAAEKTSANPWGVQLRKTGRNLHDNSSSTSSKATTIETTTATRTAAKPTPSAGSSASPRPLRSPGSSKSSGTTANSVASAARVFGVELKKVAVVVEEPLDENVDSDDEDVADQRPAINPLPPHKQSLAFNGDVQAEIGRLRNEISKYAKSLEFEKCAELSHAVRTLEQVLVFQVLNGSVDIHDTDTDALAAPASPVGPTPATPLSHDADHKTGHMSGWLEKRGQWNPSWKRRFCHLNPMRGMLFYSDSPSDVPKGGIQLDQSTELQTLTANDKDAGSCTWIVVTKNRRYRFRAPDRPSAKRWQEAIMAYILAAHEKAGGSGAGNGNGASSKSEEPSADQKDEPVETAADQQEQAELPPGWVVYIDEESGYPYYMHVETGQSQWEPPE